MYVCSCLRVSVYVCRATTAEEAPVSEEGAEGEQTAADEGDQVTSIAFTLHFNGVGRRE